VTKKILVVDDEERLRMLLESYLRQEGFEVVTANNGRQALSVARQEQPDLVLLDLMMPELDGFGFMREHSKERNTPVIILTAKLDEQEKVLGLELGADDYVTKPFSLRELTARVRAVLRRTGQVPPVPEQLRAADIVLDRGTRLVQVDEHRVDLTPSEFDLLAALMSNPGRAFSRAELLDRVQGMTYEGYERTIDVHVRNLRAKIEPDSRHPRYIETVFGIGYRFAAA
jgi:DNA-binding response OmpR family regulator